VNGYIQQSSGGPSAYYSATRMTAAGTLRGGGRTVAVRGDGWMDRQWGNWQTERAPFNYDWFSCRFDDRTELMLYRFKDPEGRALTRYESGTYVRPDGSHVLVRGLVPFRADPSGALAAGRYPQRWRLRVPIVGVDVALRSFSANQVVRNRLAPTFWEGAFSTRGTKSGYCFVEQTSR